jgi:hypothetical protein
VAWEDGERRQRRRMGDDDGEGRGGAAAGRNGWICKLEGERVWPNGGSACGRSEVAGEVSASAVRARKWASAATSAPMMRCPGETPPTSSDDIGGWERGWRWRRRAAHGGSAIWSAWARGGGGVNARDPGSRIMRRRGLETAAQWMMGGEKEPPTELATTWAVTGEKMFGAGGEGAERVNARRGKGKGEPMRLSYFHTF